MSYYHTQEMTVTEPLNGRYELRAYASATPCRLAWILRSLVSPTSPAVARDTVAIRWAERYPRHAATGRSIRTRISRALTLLKMAGIARAQGPDILVTNMGYLELAANNLSIVEDSKGFAIRPALWACRPDVPPHLQAAQEPIERQRLEAAARLAQEE